MMDVAPGEATEAELTRLIEKKREKKRATAAEGAWCQSPGTPPATLATSRE